MDALLYMKETGARVPPGQKILRKADYEALLEANTLLAAARDEALRIREDAKQVYQDEKRRGYEEGLIQGKSEMAARMLDSVFSSVDYLEKMEGMMVDVVMSALQKILGDMDQKERAVKLVRKALHYVKGQKKVVLRVSADDFDAVQAEFDAIRHEALDIGILELVADKRLEAGSCVLESDLGLVDASLETQLERIRTAFMDHLGGSVART